MLEHRKVHTSFECHHFPLLFIAEEVSSKIAKEHLLNACLLPLGRTRLRQSFPQQRNAEITDRRSSVRVLYVLEVEGNGALCFNIGCTLKINDR